jgi:hypothetical protein
MLTSHANSSTRPGHVPYFAFAAACRAAAGADWFRAPGKGQCSCVGLPRLPGTRTRPAEAPGGRLDMIGNGRSTQ